MVHLLKVQQIPHMQPSQLSLHPLIELCTGSIEDVILAAELDVDRIELNSGMAVGGLTPPAGLVAAALRTFDGPIIAMVRPREAGFAYTNAEFTQMLNDCEFLLASGVEGIAIGFLKSDGSVDIERCIQLRRLFPTATLVFHKAFDATPDLAQASQQLIDSGFNRILTSGGRAVAIDGSRVIRELRNSFGADIEYIVGGGVRANNLESIIRETGCNQIHTAARTVIADPSTDNNSGLDFGNVCRNGVSGYGAADRAQLCEMMLIASKSSGHSDRKSRGGCQTSGCDGSLARGTTKSLPVIESCDHCSACCRQTPIPPFQPGEEEVWNVPIEWLIPVQMRIAADQQFEMLPCVWLDQNMNRCLHYDHRPQACRDFQINSDLCRLSRWDEGRI